MFEELRNRNLIPCATLTAFEIFSLSVTNAVAKNTNFRVKKQRGDECKTYLKNKIQCQQT